jgi:serine/threonine protein kinase
LLLSRPTIAFFSIGQADMAKPTQALFISYSSEDKGIAEVLCAALETEGIGCWIAPRDVKGGRPYSGQITQAIREARVLLLILSAASNRSKHVLHEVDRAFHYKNPILTFRIEAVQPRDDLDYYLGADHWLDGFQPLPVSHHFSALIRHTQELLQPSRAEDQSDRGAPEMFAHYRILRHPDGSRFELGKGGMGVTYKAFDTNLNRPVALKVIGAELLRSPQAHQRFQREAQAAALIHHPYVATIYHFGKEGGDHFYAMEFVEGEDLERYVTRNGPLSPATALRVGLQVAQALEAAQARQLIHRDIKPANIMAVINRAGTMDVKLIDFGLAKGAGEAGSDPLRVTRTQDFVGSPAFASPEQCDLKKLDVRSDIYSLGVTLWYLLTGKPPFTGSVREVMNAQVDQPPPFDQLGQTPEPMLTLIRRMLEKKPEDRFQTPEELQEAIEQAVQQVSAQFGTVPERISPNAQGGSLPEQKAEPVVSPEPPLLDAYLAVQTGALLGNRYRLIAEEREGNSGRLFQARDEHAQPDQPSEVAVKLLHPGIAGDPELLNLLENELGVIRQARDPHLVRYYRLERDAAGPYLVREWVNGFLLYELLRWRRSLKASELPLLLDPLAGTLDFVAGQGLGLVDVSVRKLLVACPTEIGEFESLARGDAQQWTRCTLKLNPLSLAPLLFKSRNGWDLQTIVPMSRVLSMTQAEAGIRGTKAVRLYGRLMYELLSGRPPAPGLKSQRYGPLPELDQAGNEILRRACDSADGGYRGCQEFWGAFKENVAAQRRPSGPPPSPPSVASEPAAPPPAGVPPPKRPPAWTLRLMIVGGAAIIGLAIFAAIRSGNAPSPAPTPVPLPSPVVTTTPAPSPTVTPAQLALENASKEKPWVNSLGMKFVPVPGTKVFFCVWDTRVQDFAAFVQTTDYDATGGMWSLGKDGWKRRGATWKSPGFEQGPAYPVAGVNWSDANAFCEWLTKKEHASSLLPNDKVYGLPTDAEWSVAVGLGQESGSTPKGKNGKIKDVYPWGKQWPPPQGAGNFAGEESTIGNEPSDWSFISRYNDGWARTSPVGSFRANQYGLYDMSGNVWQWCDDWYDEMKKNRVLRGGSWGDADTGLLLSSYRGDNSPVYRFDLVGFRCVVGTGSLR